MLYLNCTEKIILCAFTSLLSNQGFLWFFFLFVPGGRRNNLMKINPDTAFFIGPCSGYEDIDGYGKKEFFVCVEESCHEKLKGNGGGKLKVKPEDDCLIYPKAMDGY